MANRVVILGGKGLLGSAVADALSYDYEVQIFSRSNGVFIEKYDTFPKPEYGVKAVLNCAGLLSSDPDNIDAIVRTNIAGPYNAARFAHENNAFFIHVSSIFAIQGRANKYYNEYGISKSAGDDLVKSFCTRTSTPHAVLRFSQLYDYKGKAASSQAMLYRLIHQLRNDGTVTIFGKKNPLRNYMNVNDAATMVKYCLENRITGLWNCIHPDSITIYDLIEKISCCLNIKGIINVLPEKPDLLSMSMPEKNLLHEVLSDFRPVSVAEGIRGIIKYGSV